MGMGEGEGAAVDSAVSLDTVEALRPLLKLREAKAQRIMQEVVQKQMMAMMGDGESPDGGGKARKRLLHLHSAPEGCGACVSRVGEGRNESRVACGVHLSRRACAGVVGDGSICRDA